MTLLNTQSLRKHSDYILMEKHLISNDVIGFIETTLGLRQNNKNIKVKLQKNFSTHFNLNLNEGLVKCSLKLSKRLPEVFLKVH